MESSETELRGPAAPWGPAARATLVALVALGLWLRLRGLSAEGFADDEVHKWLAANRYLHGVFSGDDVEHPMLMKWLIAGSIALLSRFGLAPETLTRLPNALAGGASIWATAQLGRRLFGRSAGLLAASLAAFSTTLIGYQRVAKEDTLLGLFLLLLLWCLAEAKAAADDGGWLGQPTGGAAQRRSMGDGRSPRRWELAGAASLAGVVASEDLFFLTPIPVVFYLWGRPDTAWRVPLRRWVPLTGGAAVRSGCVHWW